MTKKPPLLAILALLPVLAAAHDEPSVNKHVADFKAKARVQQVDLAHNTRALKREQDAISAVVEAVAPSTVRINVKAQTKTALGFNENVKKAGGLGSGFIVDAEKGIIVTNAHVVRYVGRNGWGGRDDKGVPVEVLQSWVSVKFSKGGPEVEAKVLDFNEEEDLALVQVDPAKLAAPLRAVKLGDDKTLKEGHWVAAIGAPFGLDETKTFGHVSKLYRQSGPGTPPRIQHDAAINPGNSGGALVNLRGEVIGVNTAIYTRAGQNAGLGVAVTVSRVKAMLARYAAEGRIHNTESGLEVAKFHFGGLIITDLVPGSPAAVSNLLFKNDIIVKINGDDINGGNPERERSPLSVFNAIVDQHKPGDVMRLVVLRGGMRSSVEVPVDVTVY